MSQCQFPVFCYFCVSEKLHRKYSWNWTKQKPVVQKFTEASREPKRGQRGATGGPHHQGARPRAGPRPHVVSRTKSTSDAAPSPIKTPRREKPKYPITFPEYIAIRRRHRPEIGRVQKLFPAPYQRGESPPEVFFIARLASGAMSEQSTLDYGSIAVASWLCSPPCDSCLELVSYFT
jgi:hypothetical protein